MKKINIGISAMATQGVSIWSNGLNMNLAFLLQCLQQSPQVGKLFLLNGGDLDAIPEAWEFDALNVPLVKPQDVTRELDVVIEMGAQLPAEWMRHMKKLGAKIITFFVGNMFAEMAQTTLFNQTPGYLFIDTPWDEVWTLPQFEKTCAPMLRTLARVPVISMPHIWSPLFLQKDIDRTHAKNPDRSFGYTHTPGKAWRIATFEPNISVAKNCFLSMLVCEQAYRLDSKSIALMMALNTFHLKDHATFNRFAIHLSLTRDQKASYEPRLSFAQCMMHNQIDAVVAHQWENSQNYAYYDALYGGYPLIHNSENLRDNGVGFYYPDFDAEAGGQILVNVWRQDVYNWENYRRRSAEYLKKLSPIYPVNVQAYTERLVNIKEAGMSSEKNTSARPHRKLRVGVTLHIRDGHQSIWENGIFQNCAFLIKLLNQSPEVERAVLVSDGVLVPNKDLMLQDPDLQLISTDAAMQTLDVVIEMSAQLSEDWVKAFRAKGGRYAWMRVGNDYVIDIERAMFNLPHAGLCNDKVYDAVWTLPEYERSCKSYFSLTARAPVRIVPHLWTPLFFERGIQDLPSHVAYGYQAGRAHWRVCSFEPNVCMVKTSFIPLLVVEEAYRAQPSFLGFHHACNTLHIKDHLKFLHFARRLESVNDGLTSFDGRFAVFEFMANYGDAIVSHHWENGQNYLYYEALYGGYPLIHNSTFIRDQGYYYPEFDSQLGGKALLTAFAEHDQNLSHYKKKAADLLTTLSTDYAPNIAAYTQELLRLYERN